MKHFVQLINRLDRSNEEQSYNALLTYFKLATESDILWAIQLLLQERPKRLVSQQVLKKWAIDCTLMPEWLFDASKKMTGDVLETIALILPLKSSGESQSLNHWMNQIIELSKQDQTIQKEAIIDAWPLMENGERFIFNRLITGAFRTSASKKIIAMALSQHTKIEQSMITQRLSRDWSAMTTDYQSLIFQDDPIEEHAMAYPFCQAQLIDEITDSFVSPTDWLAERMWNGLRVQLIVRNGELFIWSETDELLTDKFPEFHFLISTLPEGTVLDGEILAFKDAKPMAFEQLQSRLNRKRINKKLLESIPVCFVAFDILEHQNQDIRKEELTKRIAILEALFENTELDDKLLLTDWVDFDTWESLNEIRMNSRTFHCDGLILKNKKSNYQPTSNWFCWKADPLSIYAVLLYAQRGQGRLAGAYIEYTFAVWNKEELVPFTRTKALTGTEADEIAEFVKNNTIEKFGPVKSVKPQLVFEIAYEGIRPSSRHKSGLVLRQAYIKQWRKDKPIESVNTLQDLHQQMNS